MTVGDISFYPRETPTNSVCNLQKVTQNISKLDFEKVVLSREWFYNDIIVCDLPSGSLA